MAVESQSEFGAYLAEFEDLMADLEELWSRAEVLNTTFFKREWNSGGTNRPDDTADTGDFAVLNREYGLVEFDAGSTLMTNLSNMRDNLAVTQADYWNTVAKLKRYQT